MGRISVSIIGVGELSLESYAEWKILSFHVYVLILFYFVINRNPTLLSKLLL